MKEGSKKGIMVVVVVALIAAAGIFYAVNNNGGNQDSGNQDNKSSSNGQQVSSEPQKFQITIENVSTKETLATSKGSVPVPLSPPVYAVYDGDNPEFIPGQAASKQLELIAEDGFPMEMVGYLKGLSNVSEAGALLKSEAEPPFLPGDKNSFEVIIKSGQKLSLVTMFVQSNDLFIGAENGINLFDESGQPISGDITSQFQLWDAGTEMNQEPGVGEDTKPMQGAEATDVGPKESEVVRLVSEVSDGYTYPSLDKVIRVTVTPL